MVAYGFMLAHNLPYARQILKKIESHAHHYLISLDRIESYARPFFEQASI